MELIWGDLLPIREGDPLDERVLCCKCKPRVPGRYRYSTDAEVIIVEGVSIPEGDNLLGRALPRGLHHLTVEFIPDDRSILFFYLNLYKKFSIQQEQ